MWFLNSNRVKAFLTSVNSLGFIKGLMKKSWQSLEISQDSWVSAQYLSWAITVLFFSFLFLANRLLFHSLSTPADFFFFPPHSVYAVGTSGCHWTSCLYLIVVKWVTSKYWSDFWISDFWCRQQRSQKVMVVIWMTRMNNVSICKIEPLFSSFRYADQHICAPLPPSPNFLTQRRWILVL